MRASVGLVVLALWISFGRGAAAADEQRLTFERAVATALDRNPSAQVTQAEIERASALLWQTRAGSLPTLSANLNYALLDGDRKIGDRVVAGRNSVQLNANLVVPLVQPARWAAWVRGKDNVAVAEWANQEQRRLLAIAAARAYLTVLAQQRAVLTSEAALKTARAHAEFAQQRFAGGVGNRLDVVRAEQEVAASEVQLAGARVALRRAQEALGVLVGVDGPVDADGEPTWKGGAAGEPKLAERSDVRAAAARLYAARRVRRHGWVDFLPTANLTFIPFFQDPATITNPQLGWQLQLGLSWAIFDGGLRYGQHRERRVLEQQSALQLLATERQAGSEVRVARFALEGAQQALVAAKRSTALLHEALQLATLAYRVGATTNLEVIDAERRARDADLAAIGAEDAARQATLELLSSEGRFP